MTALVKKIYNIISDRELSLNAAALSFYTIFTIVPLLLILMSIVSYLDIFTQLYKQIQEMIITNFLPMNQDVIMSYLDKFLQHSLQMSLFSFFILFISSLLFFKNYEYIVNNIFSANQRSFLKSIRMYLFIMVITPISLGLTFYISIFIAKAIASHSLTSGLDILPVVPTLVIWILFFVLFKLSANIKVSYRSALISSLVVAVMFSLAKELFIYYVFLNKSYTTLYGSFSILMFLFLWIYASWFIFLNGLKLCHYINRIEKNNKALKK